MTVSARIRTSFLVLSVAITLLAFSIVGLPLLVLTASPVQRPESPKRAVHSARDRQKSRDSQKREEVPSRDMPLEPWRSNHHPTDVSKRHVEEIGSGRHAYAIRQEGTMDGTNCRSPIGVGMMDGPATQQTWESNRSVRMENLGETDVVNPWLSNRSNNFRTLDEIVAAALEANMSDKEKAFALWFQEIRHRYHFDGDNNELGDPVKVFNVYGYNTCGNDSICLAGLWRKAGLKVAPARLVGHCVSQAFYDNRWHLLDGDMHSMYLLRDNETVAGEQDLVRDHDLIRRSHTQGILNPDCRANDEWESSIYVY